MFPDVAKCLQGKETFVHLAPFGSLWSKEETKRENSTGKGGQMPKETQGIGRKLWHCQAGEEVEKPLQAAPGHNRKRGTPCS